MLDMKNKFLHDYLQLHASLAWGLVAYSDADLGDAT